MDNNPKRKRKKKRPHILRILIIPAIIIAAFMIFKDPNTEKTQKIDPNTTISDVKNGENIIAIDPGHGGYDNGAEGLTLEKKMTEKTSEYLYELLSKDGNFTPIYTRELNATEKTSIDERVQAASNAKLLISIHGNSDIYDSTTGFECFATPPGRNNHEESLKFATIIAEQMEGEGHNARGETGVRFLYYVKDKEGKTAIDLRESDYSNTNRTESGLAILERPDCPSVLIEQCFITSPSDFENWGGDSGCYKAAKVYYKAICKYFNVEPKALD